MNNFPELTMHDYYQNELPLSPRPILILGAGGIVRDAHLPAYKKAGFPVWGIVNRTRSRAQELADSFGISNVFTDLSEAIKSAPEDIVFDIALMPEQYLEALEALPDGSAVLIQKPLGYNLQEGLSLLELCKKKKLVAAVNTQLRFAPYIEKAREIIASGDLGEIYDFEIHLDVNTPWELFPHVFGLDRLEISMHSVHYVDLVRSIFGDPSSVSAITVNHPLKKEIASTRSTIIFRYPGRALRAVISTNHDHDFGAEFQESYIKIEGTKGAIKIQMGLLLDYPKGREDYFKLNLKNSQGAGWSNVPISGSWFPDAFIGSMGVLQRFVEGSIEILPTSVDDVIKTMSVVEAAYISSQEEGISINYGESK